MHTVPRGMLEAVDVLLGVLEVPIHSMGTILMQKVTIDVGAGNQVMPLSNAALAGFVMPWVTDLGNLLVAVAEFLDVL